MRHIQIVALIVLAGWQAALGQSALPNAYFDIGIDGWTTESNNGGYLEWETVLGQPPGALRLAGGDQAATPTVCFPAVLGTYLFSADAYVDAPSGVLAGCELNYALYDALNCEGSEGFFIGDVFGTWVTSPNEWQTLERNTIDLPAFDGIKSLKPMLIKTASSSAEECVFDNIHFEIIPALAPAPIPTASPVGLGALAALLAVASFVVLRRRG